jgi:hypothetical protein
MSKSRRRLGYRTLELFVQLPVVPLDILSLGLDLQVVQPVA